VENLTWRSIFVAPIQLSLLSAINPAANHPHRGRDSLQSAIRTTADKFGRLDVLHNNAGGATAQGNTAVDAPLDEFLRAITGSISSARLSAAASASRN
jgi:NAD(P)-dependent dehydrogenase (short-subunit alcohol dehydrogenase family)